MATELHRSTTSPWRDPTFFGFLTLGVMLLACGWVCGLLGQTGLVTAARPTSPPTAAILQPVSFTSLP